MPFVSVYHPAEVETEVLLALREKIRISVANHMTFDQNRSTWLGPNDMEVVFHPWGELDFHELDVLIRVDANYYSERASDKDKIAEELGEDIDQILAGYNYAVWPTLPEAGYFEKRRAEST